MEDVKLNVNGMSCGSCVNSIKGSVGELTGVSKVDVNFGEGIVGVSYDANQVDLEQITGKIEEQGYHVA
ncbi:heavy-metal-associated domain-containing protein [Salicibibacter cibi]|uniref:Copper chaperone CopZ n=1 Tax=Salicibibacter cibi TaxID=2743001 RepID=A0A7T7CFE7_9BACI|nr:copper ion binding protein [Salicibibacter cibi]QQK80060.1 heavy-metal-associated domain-containing protein [Salicibibacter cibi]